MAFNQAAMAAFADYTVANCNGRYQDLAGRDLNVDGRFGYQCMDLWIWARYRLGFMDNLPTPDAAAVWELNNQPGLRLWEFFDAITPDQPAMPGDFFVMNRNFYGNGVGHIGMVLADLGGSFRALELNGLGDGFEDNAGGQYGSPARIHDWPKTHLYGYLRWIGPAPAVAGHANTITPIPSFTDMDIDMATPSEVVTALMGHPLTLRDGVTADLQTHLVNLFGDMKQVPKKTDVLTAVNGTKARVIDILANVGADLRAVKTKTDKLK